MKNLADARLFMFTLILHELFIEAKSDKFVYPGAFKLFASRNSEMG